MRRSTKVLLALPAMLLALGSWTVTRAGADDETQAAAPTTLPGSAFLTGESAITEARLDEVDVAVQAVAGGYELTLVNPSATERALRWQLECSEVRGSPISRMGPIPVHVHEELIEARLAPRGRTTHLVRVAHPAAPSHEMFDLGAFASMRLSLRPAGAGETAGLAVLTVPVSPPAAGS